MITNTQELYAALNHLTSLTDMLTAMYLEAKENNDFALFPVTVEGYFVNVREINAEVRAYLKSHSEAADFLLPQAGPTTQEDA